MGKTISVTGLDQGPVHASWIEIDEYVPLRFHAHRAVLGSKYLRLGDFNRSLFEFMLDPVEEVVRGFTLVSFDAVHDPRAMAELPRSFGLPKIVSAGGFVGPVDAQRCDVQMEFSVGFCEDFIEIDINGLLDSRNVVVAGSVEFYIGAKGLLGMRILGLTELEVSLIKSQRIT